MDLAAVLEVGGTGVLFAAIYVQTGADSLRHHRAARRARRALSAARAALLAAAEDDPAFAPDQVRAEVGRLQAAALAGDRDPHLQQWVRWVRAWYRDPELRGAPLVTPLGVVNRAGTGEDRLDVFVTAFLAGHLIQERTPAAIAFNPLRPRRSTLQQRWTLGRDGDGWRLLAFIDEPLVDAVRHQRTIADASEDTERLHEQSVRELAQADRAPGPVPGGSLDDIAVIDGRWDRGAVDAVLVRLVEAWELATLDEPGALARLAAPDAVEALLRLDGLHVRARDLRLADWQPDEIADPRLTVAVRVRGALFLVADDGALAYGGDLVDRLIAVTWTLELAPTPDPLWRLVASTPPEHR